ncbi:MAG TPA: phosphoribosyltransferase family protein [Acidimicrobiales bacterium]|nr:phosphoribosyltransferase family protein [Acidimicrobiales bacterium]
MTHPHICASCGQPAHVPALGLPTIAPGEPPSSDAQCRNAQCRNAQCRNAWCAASGRPLQSVYWTGEYDGALRRAVVAYKYAGDMRWARTFGSLLLSFLQDNQTWFDEFGVVCPVPAYCGPGRRRSFAHMDLVAAELSSQSRGQWPMEPLVRKVVETPAMCLRPQLERRRLAYSAMRASLRADPVACAGRRVVLVDDVCVSGQTMLSVAAALRAGGAAEVVGLVLARARWRDSPVAR